MLILYGLVLRKLVMKSQVNCGFEVWLLRSPVRVPQERPQYFYIQKKKRKNKKDTVYIKNPIIP